MKNAYLLYAAIISLILTLVFAFNDNLSELAYLFLALTIFSFGWYVMRRTWNKPVDTSTAPSRKSRLLETSAVVGITGILAIGAGLLGFLSDGLSELWPLIFPGALLLVLALILRILDGIRAKRVDGTTGGLSITALVALVAVVTVTIFLLYVLWGIAQVFV
jgi:hypothetical protein